MLKKMTVENSEFNFEKLLKEAEEKQITFEFTVKDRNDAIQTISTMGSIIKALFGQIDTYDKYLKELKKDNKELHKENINFFATLVDTQSTIDELSNRIVNLNSAIFTALFNKQSFTEDKEEW